MINHKYQWRMYNWGLDLGLELWLVASKLHFFLQPPSPPPGTNLRVTHWDGEPIAFDDQVMFVCERGYHFEVRQLLLVFNIPHSLLRLTITRLM